jgi:hypothetical protein
MEAFDSITVAIESIVIILLCIIYLAMQIKGSQNLFVYSTSNFWIIIAFLIYLAGTFFLYLMTETMFNNKTFRIQYSVINSTFNILKNILFAVAMLMKSTPPPNSKSQKNKNLDDFLSYKSKT